MDNFSEKAFISDEKFVFHLYTKTQLLFGQPNTIYNNIMIY